MYRTDPTLLISDSVVWSYNKCTDTIDQNMLVAARFLCQFCICWDQSFSMSYHHLLDLGQLSVWVCQYNLIFKLNGSSMFLSKTNIVLLVVNSPCFDFSVVLSFSVTWLQVKQRVGTGETIANLLWPTQIYIKNMGEVKFLAVMSFLFVAVQKAHMMSRISLQAFSLKLVEYTPENDTKSIPQNAKYTMWKIFQL